LRGNNQFAEADKFYWEALEIRRKLLPPHSIPISDTLVAMGQSYRMQNRYADAEIVYREALEIRQKVYPGGDYRIAKTQSFLGAALAGQGRYSEAEALFLAAYEQLATGSAPAVSDGDAQPTTTANRLVQLYDAWGKPKEAAKWRDKLAASQPAATQSSN
jgi:tetratricopeptide (TPR) repeat protein